MEILTSGKALLQKPLFTAEKAFFKQKKLAEMQGFFTPQSGLEPIYTS
jgi:hypothetical protein